MSLYFFCITMAKTVSAFIFGFIANWLGVQSNPALYGPLITGAIAISYLSSLPFWWKAGKAYKEFMEEKDAREANALVTG